MKVLLISFATNDRWFRSQKRLNESAKNRNIYGCISYNYETLEPLYRQKYSHLLNNYTRGSGYWMWKSHIIKQSMRKIDEGDIILYVDSGQTIINDLTFVFNKCLENNIVFFDNRGDNCIPFTNRKWTKRDAYILMDCDSEEYYDAKQVDASIQLYKKCDFTKKFLDEFDEYSQNENIISDLPNITKENLPEFYDHRHDQSILSILAKKYNIELLPSPSQFGNCIENRPYPQLTEHHRGAF